MKCDDQRTIKLDPPKPDGNGGFIYTIPVSCGKCYSCKRNRVNGWSFRLMKELERSQSAHFVTLTYDTTSVPITDRGFMTLKKKDLQDFFKRLRQNVKRSNDIRIVTLGHFSQDITLQKKTPLKYYACGEYGSVRKRPHYHIILFNLTDVELIDKSWQLGQTHIDKVNNNTIDYTLKYIDKLQSKMYKNFDGIKEFSLMSKGLGDNYLKEKKTLIGIIKTSKITFSLRNEDIKYQFPKPLEKKYIQMITKRLLLNT